VTAADVKRVRALCRQLVKRAEANPADASALADVLTGVLAGGSETKRATRRTGRRAAPVVDPFEIYREDPDALADRLAKLNLEQLRDVVAYHGMDPRRLVMKWKRPDRVVTHIVETVQARSRKGDAFRAPQRRSVSRARPGADRTDVDYVWPKSIVKPKAKTMTVYIDLNHWIGLAKAATGHPDGKRHRAALQAIRKTSARTIFPLSSVHYMEMAGITDPRQRFDVAAVMEEISDFACVMPGSIVVALELDAAVAATAGTTERHDPIPLLGNGALQAFGRRGGLRISSPDGDITESARRAWPGGPGQFDSWTESAERELTRSVLRGPTDDKAPSLRETGWDPTISQQIASERASAEHELARQLDAESRWRRGRLRDVVAARYLANEASLLNDACTAHEAPIAEICGNVEAARRFTDSMPSADTRITLLTAAHRNSESKWTSNDVFDIDALSVAVPYCDVVVTERHARHVLQAAGLPDRVGTKVLATLDDLATLLAETDPGAP
jgi:hypothetical protein